MPSFLVRFLTVALALSGTTAFAADLVLSVKPDHVNGVYAPDEKVTWTVDVKGDRAGLTGLNALPYVIKKDGQVEVGKGTLDLSTAPATMTASRSDAGILLAQIFPMDKPQDKTLAAGGAVILPNKITPSAPAPADFDEFWQGKLKELAQVPINPVLEKKDLATIPSAQGMDYYKVTLDNIRGTHVQGQLVRPTVGEKFPAMLVVQYAGIYALSKEQAIAQAKPGWLVLNISAHDLPIDESPEYYKNLQDTTLKGYALIGEDDREKSYFLRMFLGDARAVEYLTSRPDWDGKTLVVTGASQGGLQSFVTGALCPKVTDVMTMVPAGCDTLAPVPRLPAPAVGRGGFPFGPSREIK